MTRANRPKNGPADAGTTQPTDPSPAAERRDDTEKALRGFALISKERRRQLASEGGKRAQLEKSAHRFTSEEAREAGKRGGATVAKDREHMRELGRRGGTARAKAQRAAQATQTETPSDLDQTDDPSE